MKVRVTVDYAHETTKGKVYEAIKPFDGFTPNSVWIMDDVNDEYILFPEEYEVVE